MVALDSYPDKNLQTLTGYSPLAAYGLPKPIGVPNAVKNLFRRKHHNEEASAKDEMKTIQRRLEAVEQYTRQLEDRMNDWSITEIERQEARREKAHFDGLDQAGKETWVVVNTTRKNGWGGGVYGEGVCPPGMVWK